MEKILNARVGRMEERTMAIESTMEEVTAEVRAITREFRQRSRNRDRSSEGRRNFVNAGRGPRPPENSREESEEDRGEVRRSRRKRVELPTFEGADLMGWIAQAEKIFERQSATEKEKMKFVYRCMERGLASFWFRFWRKKTTHPTWKRFTDDLTRRFGGQHQDTVVEKLPAVRQKGSLDEDIQELESLVPRTSGKPYHSSLNVSVNLGASIINGDGAAGKGGTTWGRCNSSSGTVVRTETYRGSSEVIVNSGGGQEDEEDEVEEGPEIEQKTMELSVLSASGLTQSKTMKRQGGVQGRKGLVLIDSGASYSLISTRLVKELGLKSTSPTEARVKDIAEWLLSNPRDSTGLTTNSLADASYPGVASLGEAVCGMATTRINPKHFLFWFRSHTAKEVKWGRAKHHSEDRDDGGKMNPRPSFKVFLEVVKSKRLPWEVSEINAIHSLQLMIRDSFQGTEITGPKTSNYVQKTDTSTGVMDELSSVALEMVRLIETATVLIFGVDSGGVINWWNSKIAELTGLRGSEAMGKSMVNEIIHADSCDTFKNTLSRALQGEEKKNVEFKIKHFGFQQQQKVVYLMVNTCTSKDYTDSVVGVCFVGQDITYEKMVQDKFIKLGGDYKAIVQSLSLLIPSIFSSVESASCSEWNAAMERLSGWKRDEVIGKLLPGEIFGSFLSTKRNREFVESCITANKRIDVSENILGCFCFLQVVMPDLNRSSEKHEPIDRENISESKELAYILQVIETLPLAWSLSPVEFVEGEIEESDLTPNKEGLAEGRELLEALKDIKDHLLQAYSFEKEMTKVWEVNRTKEEGKTLEEDLPPPKPPD